MKKTLIGAIVGGILLFVWQFLSWTMLDLHRPANEYTPKQDSILQYLNTQFSEDGSYMLPTVPAKASMEEFEKMSTEATGKPWVQINYHKSLQNNMVSSMIRCLSIDIVILLLLCWMLGKMGPQGFGTIFAVSLAIGFINFFASPYTNHIWFQIRDLNAYLIDAVVAWGLVGVWLGWWLRKKA